MKFKPLKEKGEKDLIPEWKSAVRGDKNAQRISNPIKMEDDKSYFVGYTINFNPNLTKGKIQRKVVEYLNVKITEKDLKAIFRRVPELKHKEGFLYFDKPIRHKVEETFFKIKVKRRRTKR